MEKTKNKKYPLVNANNCKACGYCQAVCPVSALATSEQMNSQGYHYTISSQPEKCVGCLRCLMICPDFAISIEEHME